MMTVNVWEEEVNIPTYEPGQPDKNPMFLEKRVYQGSSGKIYPYPTTQVIRRSKTDHTYKAVFLENEYLKVMILPELGGRIQRAYDKTNGYDFVYYNHVIKPALVGLLGPWISGGIEFNWPQHHRPTTFMPVDHVIEENADGSKSVLINDVDQINGTKEITRFTLYPGKAYIEIKGQLYNRTPMPQTFLWWANPAVPVNDNTQSIFPTDVHNVYDHGKRAVSRFPIATGEYYKHDYSAGVDISRYKNIPVPTSYMAEKSDYDFVGNYDYQRRAGLLHVADHHVSTGKKQWTWGCGDFGKAWDRNLTDEDGPYIELMTGMYCDNQPDFSWLKPYEEKTFTQYFMPYKEVGQVKNASIHAALGYEMEEDGLRVKVYGTEEYESAELHVYYKDQLVYSEPVQLSPIDPLNQLLPVQVEDEYQLKLEVTSEGRELVSFQAVDPGIPKIAEPANVPEAPESVQTNEELYIIAQHIEQYRHATWLPDDYYLEGLKRDPGDIRINNAYGLLLFRRGCFEEAEEHFHKAIERLTQLHPNPYFGEPFYNLGLALFYQGKYEDAYDAFYKATWTNEEQEMAFYYLAAIDSRRGEYENALMLIDKGLVKNMHNVKARALKAYLLRKLGRLEDAKKMIEENLSLDHFDYVSRFIQSGLPEASQETCQEMFRKLSRDHHETYLQAARDFIEIGANEEAVKILDSYQGMDKPMIHYYKAYALGQLGDEAYKKALVYAEDADPSYTFPNKLEDILVLNYAIDHRNNCAKALYYLGCLYYDKLQFDRAMDLWEKSKSLDSNYPTVLRNLSIGYYNKKHDEKKALLCMEEAFALDPGDSQVFIELDQLQKKLNVSFEKRLARYEKHRGIWEDRDDIYTEYVTILNQLHRYQDAYDAIQMHVFQTWEGAEGKISTQFKLSLLGLARKTLDMEGFTIKEDEVAALMTAEKRLLEALSYPEFLGEGKLEGTKDNHIWFHLGLVYEKMQEKDKAKECFENAVQGAMEPAGMMYYYDQPADMILYQALALEKLGRVNEANTRYYKLIDYGEKHVFDQFHMDYFAVSMPDFAIFDEDMTKKNQSHCYYLMGLGQVGLKDNEKAREFLQKTLQLDSNHQNADWYMKVCGK